MYGNVRQERIEGRKIKKKINFKKKKKKGKIKGKKIKSNNHFGILFQLAILSCCTDSIHEIIQLILAIHYLSASTC